jgi:hypothetical protein
MRFFVFVAYCFGMLFAAVVAFGFVDTVYSSRQVVNGVGVESELTRDDLLQSESNIVREAHRIDFNQIEVLLTGENSLLFRPITWETGLGVYATTYLMLILAVFAFLAVVATFFIRLGSDTHKRATRGRLGR